MSSHYLSVSLNSKSVLADEYRSIPSMASRQGIGLAHTVPLVSDVIGGAFGVASTQRLAWCTHEKICGEIRRKSLAAVRHGATHSAQKKGKGAAGVGARMDPCWGEGRGIAGMTTAKGYSGIAARGTTPPMSHVLLLVVLSRIKEEHSWDEEHERGKGVSKEWDQ